MKRYRLVAAFAAAAVVTFSGTKLAYGELVFDDELNQPQQQQQSTQQLMAAPKAESRIEERSELSKSEVMRRQRLREELKNEDLLTQKLEELRLRDEVKRTDELLGSGVNKQANEPLAEQRVGSAAVEPVTPTAPGAANPALNSQVYAVNGTPQGAVATTTAEVSSAASDEEANQRVSVSARAGTASITNSVYDVQAKIAGGVQVAVDMSDHIAFTGGYTYAKYSLGAGSTINAFPVGIGMNNLQRLNMNDNVFDIGVRAYFLNPRSKVRPYIGAGLGYRRGYVNYDDNTQKFLRSIDPQAARDVEISGFSGFIETGLEFRLTKAISLTGTFRYFNIFSASQSNPLNPNGFLNPNGYNGAVGQPYYYGAAMSPYGYVNYNQDTRGQAGDALAKNNFYQLMAGVAISF